MSRFQRIVKLVGWLLGGATVGSLASALGYAVWIGASWTCFFQGYGSCIFVAGVAGAVAGGFMAWWRTTRRQRVLFLVAAIFWSPIIGLFGSTFVYQPVKFSYLIWRVESARTPDEEKAALELAQRWGCCWEIHLESPPKTWLDWEQLDAVVQDADRALAVELEWLESKPSGVPYRARRTLVDKDNIYILIGR
ncbi:MAG: hypothetical protein H7A46_22780 [Verrucomicrobiales bacterium]|nr:hypothetical protein [Planctomycetota bacterium]MCP5524368.1 hypothetical protein [Verrucomicrobiales bacterium]